ncbi:MAG: hypothetical protein KC587_18600, partial [Nitrospira sp.]|nr:hypothetical protein [Nitrospira sp.]
EFKNLMNKERPEFTYQPVYGSGGLYSENEIRKLAEHNVIVNHQQELERIQNTFTHKFDAILASQGWYVREQRNTKENLPKHFNERGAYARQNQSRGEERGR